MVVNRGNKNYNENTKRLMCTDTLIVEDEQSLESIGDSHMI
jgi:hypothetical protein